MSDYLSITQPLAELFSGRNTVIGAMLQEVDRRMDHLHDVLKGQPIKNPSAGYMANASVNTIAHHEIFGTNDLYAIRNTVSKFPGIPFTGGVYKMKRSMYEALCQGQDRRNHNWYTKEFYVQTVQHINTAFGLKDPITMLQFVE
jgi:hypothetical protein